MFKKTGRKRVVVTNRLLSRGPYSTWKIQKRITSIYVRKHCSPLKIRHGKSPHPHLIVPIYVHRDNVSIHINVGVGV